MRNAFASELTKLAVDNDNIVLLSADIGNKLFDRFKDAAPGRFINCGVAEANMIGTAAGLSMSGLLPVTYTIAPFITYRCLEQIRVDLCYHKLPCVIVGTGAGLSYASLGATHHSLEDIAMMRALPNIRVVCPGDAHEVRLALGAAIREPGPVYLRLGKKGEPLIHEKEPQFAIGKAIEVRSGRDICILTTGNVLALAVDCAKELSSQDISCAVFSFHTVKPLDVDLLMSAFSKFKLVVSLEEHSAIGGLAGAIAEWFVDQDGLPGKLLAIGTPDQFMHEAGGQAYARGLFGLTKNQVLDRILHKLAINQLACGGR